MLKLDTFAWNDQESNHMLGFLGSNTEGGRRLPHKLPFFSVFDIGLEELNHLFPRVERALKILF
jgi:hypothetical protein